MTIKISHIPLKERDMITFRCQMRMIDRLVSEAEVTLGDLAFNGDPELEAAHEKFIAIQTVLRALDLKVGGS